jgi:hypothetical protein
MMRGTAWIGSLVAFLAVAACIVGAQGGGKLVRGGNPTPGTPQPDPPNLSDRITLTGCLQALPKSSVTTETADANMPSSARFGLSSAQRADRLPPGTGGSELATKTSSRSYRLEGLDSQFATFVNAKVEISGEVKPRPAAETGESVPILIVEFIQKTGPTCES